jgi:phospholipid-binding lipoprotein MlaA
MTQVCSFRSGARAAAIALALAGLTLAGCATRSETAPGTQAAGVYDPLEPMNRAIYNVNEGADILVIRPVAEIYRGTVPDPIRTAVRNFLQNLAAPLVIANELLQADFAGAQTAFERLLVNTTIGIGGFVDIAGMYLDKPFLYEDFGQTLAVWGVPEGPYLVLPILGPSNFRDAGGRGVDFVADPVGIAVDSDAFSYTRAGVSGVDTRAGLIEPIDDIRRNSLDPYAALRSLYQQRRETEIRDGAVAPSQEVEFPEFDDVSLDIGGEAANSRTP